MNPLVVFAAIVVATYGVIKLFDLESENANASELENDASNRGDFSGDSGGGESFPATGAGTDRLIEPEKADQKQADKPLKD